MMVLSRFWYAVLTLLAALAIAVVILAVGQYNRRNQVAMTEELAGDSQVIKWALQIDARRRLDALLIGAVDKGVQDAVVAANGQDKVPQKARDEAKKALAGILEKMSQPPLAEFKPDAIFVVDHDGRLVAQSGYDKAQTFEDFELGGYAAVNDALHGYLRDDTWVWGGQLYRVVARPVEYDVTQPPAGAIVALRGIDRRFAQELAQKSRTNIVFYAAGAKVASAANEASDEAMLDLVQPELPQLASDKAYGEKAGRSEVRPLGELSAAMFTKLEGDAWDNAGVAVVRSRVAISGPMGFLTGADDKDKKALVEPGSLITLILVVLLGIGGGILFSVLEHSSPIGELRKQAERLKKGDIDLLQLPRIRGELRAIATDLNAGIERVAEKGAGAPRKVADLESILGPTPAAPAMSAFAFPMPGADAEVPDVPPAPPPKPAPPKPAPPAPQRPSQPSGSVQRPNTDVIPPQELPDAKLMQPLTSPTAVNPIKAPVAAAPKPAPAAAPAPAPKPAPEVKPQHAAIDGEEESTMVAAIPQDVLEQAKKGASGELAEWKAVYEEFVKVKKQCNEPTEGLTFEKFQGTLRKNRDALVERHKCKRVKFTVYVKDGRASLKATPVKD